MSILQVTQEQGGIILVVVGRCRSSTLIIIKFDCMTASTIVKPAVFRWNCFEQKVGCKGASVYMFLMNCQQTSSHLPLASRVELLPVK